MSASITVTFGLDVEMRRYPVMDFSPCGHADSTAVADAGRVGAGVGAPPAGTDQK